MKVSRRWLVDQFVRYRNFWQSYLELNYEEPRLDDREIGNGLPFERPGRPGLVLQGGTDKRSDVFIDAGVFAQKLPSGGNVEGKIRALVRAHPQLELELIPTVTRTTGETRFAARGALPNELIFGDLGASSFATTARVSFTITPRLALQTFAQLFLASGHYDDFRSFVTAGGGPGSENIRLGALTPSAPPVASPDFQDVSLNLNVVLRWEYSLGSVLYFVFNRSQTPATPLLLDQPAALSFTPLGRAPAVDTLLVKWQLFVNL